MIRSISRYVSSIASGILPPDSRPLLLGLTIVPPPSLLGPPPRGPPEGRGVGGGGPRPGVQEVDDLEPLGVREDRDDPRFDLVEGLVCRVHRVRTGAWQYLRPREYSHMQVCSTVSVGPNHPASKGPSEAPHAEQALDGGLQRDRGQALPRRDHGVRRRRDGDGRGDLPHVLRARLVPPGPAPDAPEEGRELRRARADARAAD